MPSSSPVYPQIEADTRRSESPVTPLAADQNPWPECLAFLTKTHPEKQVRTWLHPLQTEWDAQAQQLKIYIASRFKLDYIRSQYHNALCKAFQQICSSSPSIQYVIGRTQGTQGAQETTPSAPIQNTTTAAPQAPAAAPAPSKTQNHYINPELTFDSLVEGSSNRMARTTGLHIATQGKGEYNPLFIYGASGLGKTHLLHAIGNQFMQSHPGSRVLYVPAVKFVTDVITACRNNSFEPFKEQYHALDLLMIDDVQEFSDKNKTLQEFFTAFETLLSKRSHIILTSDTYPKDLEKIPERLISRFVSGLVVGLEPPNVEMRVAILQKKAEKDKVKLPDEVAFFIAKNVQSNVRELEGALRNVLAAARFRHQAVNIATTRDALRDLLAAHKRQITIENIQKTVADYYHIKVADMHSKRRPANIALPRQIAMYLTKEMTQKSLPEIGQSFGGRDHTTVLHAVRKIGKDRQTDSLLNQQLHLLEQSLKG